MSIVSIRSFNDKDLISDRVFLVKDKSMGVGKNGKPFITVLLGDKTGQIDCKIWDNVEIVNQLFNTGDLINIKGVVQVYNQRKQLVIHRIENVTATGLKTDDFIIEEKKFNSQELFLKLISIVNKIESSYIKQICLDCINDESLKEKLLRAPAAKTIHHAFSGGLLFHIISICQLMESIASQYDYLNKDLLIFGALFHDLGKIDELDIDSNGRIYYTDKGQLLGHMYLSCDLVEKKSQKILGFPEDLRLILKHIILSHHGKIEYGSPKLPMIPEALVVAMIDDFDSKMDQVTQFINHERLGGEKWSRFNENFDRYFYLEILKGKWI